MKIKSNSKIWYYTKLIKSNRVFDLSAKNVRQSDIAALLYSSGMIETSTGVILMHKNFIAMLLMVTADQDRHGEPRNVFLCFIPMFHVFGLSVTRTKWGGRPPPMGWFSHPSIYLYIFLVFSSFFRIFYIYKKKKNCDRGILGIKRSNGLNCHNLKVWRG
jgi:acyl-CoA synthetase (AMP-forming)/AMP-acid ligase II